MIGQNGRLWLLIGQFVSESSIDSTCSVTGAVNEKLLRGGRMRGWPALVLAGIFVLRMITPNRIQEEKLGLAPGSGPFAAAAHNYTRGEGGES